MNVIVLSAMLVLAEAVTNIACFNKKYSSDTCVEEGRKVVEYMRASLDEENEANEANETENRRKLHPCEQWCFHSSTIIIIFNCDWYCNRRDLKDNKVELLEEEDTSPVSVKDNGKGKVSKKKFKEYVKEMSDDNECKEVLQQMSCVAFDM